MMLVHYTSHKPIKLPNFVKIIYRARCVVAKRSESEVLKPTFHLLLNGHTFKNKAKRGNKVISKIHKIAIHRVT
jgi:hypothetical protein